MNTTDFRIVVLDCPYNTWANKDTQELFSAIVGLKLKGYLPVYEHGVMPVDSYDFIATHLLVCVKEQEHLRPVTGFKSVTVSACERFNLPFPTNAVLANTRPGQHREAVHQIMDRCRESGKELCFDSSWTVDPEFRKHRELHLLLQELFISNVIQWHRPERAHEVLGTGILRVRTNRFFERVGFHPVELDGEPLPPFEQPSLQGSSAVLIHLQESSSFARGMAEKHQQLWENRITIN
ncbi:MAG: hypothetical protein QM796_10240 [Chthoniobacteraceae bacterium]